MQEESFVGYCCHQTDPSQHQTRYVKLASCDLLGCLVQTTQPVLVVVALQSVSADCEAAREAASFVLVG